MGEGITRRRVLVGGGATVVVAAAGIGLAEAAGVLPQSKVDRLLGRCPSDGPPAVPPTTPVVRAGTFRSEHAPDPVGWTMVWPEGTTQGTAIPLVLCLHGASYDHTEVASLRLADRLAAVVRAGRTEPFALAAVDGGAASYWHRRADGRDPMAVLLDDFLPRCQEAGLGADGRRIGLLGWSMGGYGALLAAETRPERFVAVAAGSPALARTYGDAASSAFDDEADYERHDVFAGVDRLRDVAVRLECGTHDPFLGATKAFARALPRRPVTSFAAGCHDQPYWESIAAAQLTFLGRHLHA